MNILARAHKATFCQINQHQIFTNESFNMFYLEESMFLWVLFISQEQTGCCGQHHFLVYCTEQKILDQFTNEIKCRGQDIEHCKIPARTSFLVFFIFSRSH